jgi:hypothetical protein
MDSWTLMEDGLSTHRVCLEGSNGEEQIDLNNWTVEIIVIDELTLRAFFNLLAARNLTILE